MSTLPNCHEYIACTPSFNEKMKVKVCHMFHWKLAWYQLIANSAKAETEKYFWNKLILLTELNITLSQWSSTGSVVKSQTLFHVITGEVSCIFIFLFYFFRQRLQIWVVSWVGIGFADEYPLGFSREILAILKARSQWMLDQSLTLTQGEWLKKNTIKSSANRTVRPLSELLDVGARDTERTGTRLVNTLPQTYTLPLVIFLGWIHWHSLWCSPQHELWDNPDVDLREWTLHCLTHETKHMLTHLIAAQSIKSFQHGVKENRLRPTVIHHRGISGI